MSGHAPKPVRSQYPPGVQGHKDWLADVADWQKVAPPAPPPQLSPYKDVMGNPLTMEQYKLVPLGAPLRGPDGKIYIKYIDSSTGEEGITLADKWVQEMYGAIPGEGGGGSGTQGPAYSSTAAGVAAQQAFDAAEAEKNRQLERDMEAQRIEESKRSGALTTLRDLVTRFAQDQAEARRMATQLGSAVDPFAFASSITGQGLFGLTPHDAYRQSLGQFAAQPGVTIDPNAPRNVLEQQIGQVSPYVGQIPMAPGVFGMAEGGNAAFGPYVQNILVGERGPEIMQVGPNGVRVIPHEQMMGMPIHGRAATGGEIPYTKDAIENALQPLFAAIGYKPQPAQHLSDGYVQVKDERLGPGGTLAQFGFMPSLARDPRTGAIYYNDVGKYRHVASQEAMNVFLRGNPFDPHQIYNLGSDPKQWYNVGPPINSYADAAAVMAHQAVTPTGTERVAKPLIEPLTNLPLPAPFTIASHLNNLKMRSPAIYDLILKAYEQVDWPINAVEGQINNGLIRGIGNHIVGLR